LRVSRDLAGLGNCDFELKNGSGFYLQGFISGARFEHTTSAFFFLCILVAKVETVILS